MPQQINLCTPIFLTQKRYFSASKMAQALGVFLLLGSALLAFVTWSLQEVSAGYRQTVSSNQRELDRLQAAIKINLANSAPMDAALVQELQQRRDELQHREQLLDELRRGLAREGWGHSARMQLVARSIPPQVWVTEIKSDDTRFELSGYTVEPAALNVWMARLADSPLLQGQQLSTVKVERAMLDLRDGAVATAATAPAGTAPAARPAGPAVWSYTLVSAIVAAPAAAAASGAKR
jgi:Tfp pilus assembly protein PilN